VKKRVPPSPEKLARIRANIHMPAQAAIPDWETFDWHRSNGAIDTDVPHSSQAFCISVWGTLARGDAGAARAAVADLLGDQASRDALREAPTLRLEHVSRPVLNEYLGKATNIDAFLIWPGLAIAVESKLREDYGPCSQAPRNCTGRYEVGSDLKTGTDAPCRLEVQDGKRTPRAYWEVMGSLAHPGAYPTGERCPFAGGGYQVMRTIAFAARHAERQGCDWRAVFVFPGSRSLRSGKTIDAVTEPLLGEHKKRVLRLDYEALARRLVSSDDPTSLQLGRYMEDRLATALA